METIIYGAGLLGRTAKELLDGQASIEIIGFIDDDPWKEGTKVCGLSVIGRGRELPTFLRFGVEAILVAISDGETRLWLSKLAGQIGYRQISAISKTAHVSPDAIISDGCILSDRVRVEEGAVIGDSCFLGAGCTVERSARVPDGSNVAGGTTVNAESVPETMAREFMSRSETE